MDPKNDLTALLLKIANEEAQRLQIKEGREPKGITSTQVLGALKGMTIVLEMLAVTAQHKINNNSENFLKKK